MDKNFIKIDDLVRQRLGGAEERERSGAWANMRDLLDKEMPQQKRVGILYWRRIFSAVAVLSLVGTVCIGSLELSSLYKNMSNDNATLATNADVFNNEPGNSYATIPDANDAEGAEQTSSNTANENNLPNAVVSNNRATVAAVHNNTSNKQDEIAKGATIVNRPNNIDESAKKGAIVATSTKGAETQRATVSGLSNENVAVKKHLRAEASAEKSMGASSPKSERLNNTQLAKNNSGDNNNVASNENDGVSTSNVTTKSKPIEKASIPVANIDNRKSVARLDVKKPIASETPSVVSKDMKELALNSGAAAGVASASGHKNLSPVPVMVGKIAAKPETTSVGEHKLGGKMPTVSPTNSTSTMPVAKAAVKSSEPLSTGGTMSANTVTKTKSGTSFSTGGVQQKAVKKPDEPKRVISKLWVSVHERVVLDANNEVSYEIDTISMRRISLDLGGDDTEGSESATEGAELTGVSSDNSGRVAKREGAKTEGGLTTGEGEEPTAKRVADNSTPEEAAGNTPVAASPAGASEENNSAVTATTSSAAEGTSTATSNEKAETPAADREKLPLAATVAKEKKVKSKEKKGVSLIKKLNAAFNEVKTNAANTRFTTGIVAGINSNFFGPNSFKGFQFGMTGNIIFNNTWNIMTELKYFQRINNNTSVEDDYYTYTPIGGQYSKTRQLNSYGFSALHSIEMPVAIRYSKGKFNFFTGGNFLYAFSINTGAATMPDRNTPAVLVNEVGQDNAPKLNSADFNSRFGLGYLLGFSYQVGNNVSFDLRSVQTVWDNAATTGAKSVSSQLFKAPSMQLSIMYRLGGNRHRD